MDAALVTAASDALIAVAVAVPVCLVAGGVAIAPLSGVAMPASEDEPFFI